MTEYKVEYQRKNELIKDYIFTSIAYYTDLQEFFSWNTSLYDYENFRIDIDSAQERTEERSLYRTKRYKESIINKIPLDLELEIRMYLIENTMLS